LGIRLPLVIVSPYAKRGFTDHNVATHSSILAYTEKTLGVSPVSEEDERAYDFHESFNYSTPSRGRFVFRPAAVPHSSSHLHPPLDAT
jgi:phospholipase C